MDTVTEAIPRSALFKGLSDDHLKDIRRIGIDRRFGKREPVFFEGEDCKGFFLVIEGMVRVFKVSVEGKEQTLHFFGPGEPLGEVPVFSGQPFPANAEAIEPSRLIFFPRQAFVDLISVNPSLSLNLLAVLSMRLHQFAAQIENLSLKEVPARVASHLVYLAEEQGREDSVTLTISKGQLASLLGTIPETLSRIFARMTDQGFIRVSGRTIDLLDVEGLELLADGG